MRVSALSNGGPAPSLGEEVGFRLLRVILAPEAQPAHQVYHLCSEKGSYWRLIDSCIRNPVSWSGGQEHSLESYSRPKPSQLTWYTTCGVCFRVQGFGLTLCLEVNKPGIKRWYSSRLENNCFAVMRSSSKEGSYLRLVDFCITQLYAESNKEEERN